MIIFHRTCPIASMKTRLLALALTVFPVAVYAAEQSPEPRRPDRVTQPPDASKQDSQPNQPAAVPPSSPTKPLNTDNAGNQTPVVTSQDKQQLDNQSVAVRSMPPLDVQKDRIDYSNLVLTGVLLGVAIWQIILLRKTVTATETAARAAADSTRIAERSLRLLNRPWLDTADWRADANLGPAIADGDGGYTQDLLGFTVSFNIVNNGPTPARLRYISVEYTAVTASNSSTGRVNPEAVSHVINPTGRYRYPVHIQGLVTTHQNQYLSPDGFKVNIRGVIYFDDVFRKVDTGTIGPKPFQTESTFSGREWHFGRNCILRPKQGETEFIVPFGHEGVGVNDEDWDKEREHDQSQNQP